MRNVRLFALLACSAAGAAPPGEKRQMDITAIMLPKSGGHKMTPSKRDSTTTRQDPARGTVIEGVARRAGR